ncbi:hypothetical protein [Streptomyces sp. uw30]|uniref:hypothetical protein n=1 Tax=Streptomyces sp. uw30 TaxID=1828179 RepID=UPI0021C67291|nr:hypothetical protein [Streptomyces sp. uw30]
MHAQRGELAQAAQYWRRVQERHPQDPAAAAGLARIDRLGRRGPVRCRPGIAPVRQWPPRSVPWPRSRPARSS